MISAVSIFTVVLIAVVLASESGAAEELDLKLRLKPGQKYSMRIDREDKISQTIMGQQRNIARIKTAEMAFEVKEVNANGIASIKATYQTWKEKSSSAGGQVLYDSTDASNPMAQTYTAIMGESFLMKVTSGGRILGLKGIDEMFLRMAEKIIQAEDESIKETIEKRIKEGAEERAKESIERTNERYGSREKRIEAVKEMIRNNSLFAEAQIREMVANIVMPFPNQSVGMGDSWVHKEIMGVEPPVEIDKTYTLKERKEGVAIVAVNSKLDLGEEGASVGVGPAKKTIKMTCSFQGASEIDEASGWMIRSKVKIQLSGEMEFTASEQKPEKMTVPMSIETIITVEPME